ncbi:MAG TPA: energy transducer TonB [Terriglobales bacterium]|nr:energy transducer TonB [Terriglobales bacterium]
MRVRAFVGVKLLLGCVLVLGSAAAAPETRAQDITSDQSARKIKSKVIPEYPAVARQLNLHGKVKIEVRVSADGHVTSTNVLGGHPTLAVAAEVAVKKWRFEPGTKETTEIIEVVFTARN